MAADSEVVLQSAPGARARLWVPRSVEVEPVKLPPRSPSLNAYPERFVLSNKSECLDWVIPPGKRHLRRLIDEYTAHDHLELHDTLKATSPLGKAATIDPVNHIENVADGAPLLLAVG